MNRAYVTLLTLLLLPIYTLALLSPLVCQNMWLPTTVVCLFWQTLMYFADILPRCKFALRIMKRDQSKVIDGNPMSYHKLNSTLILCIPLNNGAGFKIRRSIREIADHVP